MSLRAPRIGGSFSKSFPFQKRGVASGVSAFRTAALALNPLVYWGLDEPGGVTAADASGNGRTGTYGSGVTPNQATLITGDSGKAGLFDNTGNAKITSGYNPFTQDLTFFWVVNLTNFTGQVSVFGGASNPNAPTLVLANATGQPTWFSDVAAAAVTWLAGDHPAGAKVFGAMTWNNTSKNSELFIGGVSKGVKVSANAFNAAPGNLQLGAQGTNTGWRGIMDDFFIVAGVVAGATIANLNAVV